MVITSYRDHVQAMVKGISPEAVMAELYGKAGGCVERQGRLDAYVLEGARVLTAATASSAARSASGPVWPMRRNTEVAGQVVMCFFGEAAVNQGIFHESLNMAAAMETALSFTFAKTTNTAWAPRRSAR